VCILGLEKGRFPLGVLVAPSRLARALARGLLLGLLIVGITDLLIVALSDYRHVAGEGINWPLILALIVPAAFGEELVFRGYVLQKLSRTSRGYAIFVTSLLFALAHGGNPAMGLVSFANIFLAGVLLALMWVWDGTLWAPTGGHIAWNVVSGPILGHELSGLDLGPTLLSEVDHGPSWLTGGPFGLEASVVLTVVEIGVILFLVWRIRLRDGALGNEALATAENDSQLPDIQSGVGVNQNDEVDSQ